MVLEEKKKETFQHLLQQMLNKFLSEKNWIERVFICRRIGHQIQAISPYIVNSMTLHMLNDILKISKELQWILIFARRLGREKCHCYKQLKH